jgi:hypothetical protein
VSLQPNPKAEFGSLILGCISEVSCQVDIFEVCDDRNNKVKNVSYVGPHPRAHVFDNFEHHAQAQ